MNKFDSIAVLAVASCWSPRLRSHWPRNRLLRRGAAAAATGPTAFSIYLGGAFGSGLIISAPPTGIGRIGSAAVESMARQPEVAGNINTAMIIAAALIEGVTFFALIVCMLAK